jgi:dethiobiotin synthetase
LVEGAGGLLAPYGASADGATTNADLAAGLGFPVLLVARTALGTINHIGLTVAELRRRKLPFAGVLLVRHAAAAAPHEASNDDLIAQLTGYRPLGTLSHLPEPGDPDCVADALERALPPAVLNGLLSGAGASAA